MATTTDTTAAHPAPRWAADPSTDVLHERGDDVHPDDAHTSYTRSLASWATTPEQANLSPIALRVTLHGWRHDDGRDDSDTVCVLEQHLVAADARRLGQVLLRAADLLEGPLASGADDPGVLAGCPAWCRSHAIHDEDGSISHQTSVRVGTMAAHVEQVGDGHQGGPCDPQGAAVYPPEVEWVHGHDAHDYAEAMRRAAWLVHPITEA